MGSTGGEDSTRRLQARSEKERALVLRGEVECTGGFNAVEGGCHASGQGVP